MFDRGKKKLGGGWFGKSSRKSKRGLRRTRQTQLERLEDRVMLSLQAEPIRLLPTGIEPLDLSIAPIDHDPLPDLVALGANGHLTFAHNAGDDTWTGITTTDLGIGPADGMAVARFDGDMYSDVAVQGPDGIHLFTGDGTGGFTLSQTIAAGSPGTFAPDAGGRIRMAAAILDQDPWVDLVSVSPGTNEVLLLRGASDGRLAAPVQYGSGGDEPVAVAVGNFLGDATPDIAVGHTDGTVAFLEGLTGGNFQLRSDASVYGLGAVADLSAADWDSDGDLDLMVSAGSQVTLLSNNNDPVNSSPLVNGDFSAGLSGWTTEIVGHAPAAQSGSVSAAGGFAQLRENESFLVSLSQTFVVPPSPQTVSFDIVALGLDQAASGIPDAFEVSLLDSQGNSLVSTIHGGATSFFNVNPGGQLTLAPGVTFDGSRVTLPISMLTPGTEATLYFDLVGNPPGASSVASIDNVRITPDTVLAETFSVTTLPGTLGSPAGIAQGDVDGDGTLDLVVADAGLNRLLVFNGDGHGGFTRSERDLSRFGTQPLAVATGPLTAGDTVDDVAITLFGSHQVLTPLMAQLDTTGPEVTFVSPAAGELLRSDLAEIRLRFSEPVVEAGPAAYQLVSHGPNGIDDGGTGDDLIVTIASVEYDNNTLEAVLTIDSTARPLFDGTYHLLVEGDDPVWAITDLAGNRLGGGVDATTTFTVNKPPVLVALGGVVADEGQNVTLSTNFADAGFLDPHSALIDWGDGVITPAAVAETSGNGTITAHHTYADNGTYAIRLTVTDSIGNAATTETTASVHNVAPTVTAAPTQQIVFGSMLSIAVAAFSDPGHTSVLSGTEETFTATIDWGDGTVQPGVINLQQGSAGVPTTGTVSGEHGYGTPGAFTVSVTIRDDDGAEQMDQFQVLVTDAPGPGLRIIDFETDAQGQPLDAYDLVSEQWAAWGVHVTTDSPYCHPARIFDSANPGWWYADLGTPNHEFGGPGWGIGGEAWMPGENRTPLDNVLVVSGCSCPWFFGPADSGTLVFTFDTPVTMREIHLLDVDLGRWEGLSQGFWRQSHHFDDWVGFAPTDSYNTVFGVNDAPGLTLAEALRRGGGGKKALGRQAVAAILNASNPTINYRYDFDTIKADVQAAYASGQFEWVKHRLEVENCRGTDPCDESGGTITLWDASGDPIAAYPITPLGNNSFQVATLGDANVSRVEVKFVGTAAVSELVFSQEDTLDASLPPTRLFTVDAAADAVFPYAGRGTSLGSFPINVPEARGVTTNAAGNPLWIVDQSGSVSIVDSATHARLGSWQADDVQDPQDIVTDGTHLWIVDAACDRVFYYADAAALRSGHRTADSSFALAPGNTSPTGIITDGSFFWVCDDQADAMFVYGATGAFQGAWQLDPANRDPSGVTMRPSGGTGLWVVDRSDGVIYYYADATARRMGTQTAAGAVVLATGNTQPEGVADPAVPIEIGVATSGAISASGEVDEYVFDATAGQTLFFDSVTGSRYDLDWRLIDPLGNQVFSIHYDNYGPLTLAASGQYTLVVCGQGNDTGSYQFTVYDLPPPVTTPVAIGDVVSGQISLPGEEDHFTFEGTEGQQVFFDVQNNASSKLAFTILRADGSFLMAKTFLDRDVFALPATETYTVVVGEWSAIDATGNYQFQIVDVPDPVITPLTVGQLVSGQISIPGEEDHFTFAGTAGQRVFFDVQNNASSMLAFTILRADGSVAMAKTFLDRDVFALPATETYTVVVGEWRTIDATGTYEFQVFDVPESIATPIVIGQVVEGELSVPGEEDIYTFTGTTGQRLFFDVQLAGTSSTDRKGFTILKPDGTVLFANSELDRDTFTLPVDGEYRIVVGERSAIDAAGPYRFWLVEVPSSDAVPITYQQVVSGQIGVPGEEDRFTFVAIAGQQVNFDVHDTSGGKLAFTLQAPDGSAVFNSAIADQLGQALTQTGIYTLIVTDRTTLDATGTYGFRLVELIQPPSEPIGDRDSKGTDFWLAFPGNFTLDPEPQSLHLSIAAEADTECTIAIPGLGFYETIPVYAGQIASIEIPAASQIDVADAIRNLGIHVTARKEVSVYGLSLQRYSTDAYQGLPVDVLGTEHIILAYPFSLRGAGPQLTVVATADGTVVTITPSVTTGSRTAGVPYSVTLNKGQVYQLRHTTIAGGDLTGTTITSTEPVTVYGGHQCANVPVGELYANYLVEQLPSVDTWGKHFFSVPLAIRLQGDTFRFLAAEDGTTVRVNGVVVATLNANQVHEQIVDGVAEIEADKPILVAQYSNGTTYDGVVADPFMMLIPAFEQYQAEYTVTTPATLFDINFINLVVPEGAIGTVAIDGVAVPLASFAQIGSSAWFAAQVPVDAGSHHLTGSLPFGAMMYGYAEHDGYGYPGGAFLAPVAHVTNLTLEPETAAMPIHGTQHFTATITDADNQPLRGVRVDFHVVGANFHDGFALTDELGRADFAYVGLNPGLDTITASVGGVTDTSTARWTASPPSLQIVSPADGVELEAGTAALITGRAHPGDPLTPLVLVTVNGQAVDSIDAAGNFFAQVPVAVGSHSFDIVATDILGQTASVTITFVGVETSPATVDFDQLEDVTTQGHLTFHGTTFNRATHTLLAEARLVNQGNTPLDSPVLAVFDRFTPPAVNLTGHDGLTPTDRPYLRFDTELPAAGLAPGAASSSVLAHFANPARERFTAEVTLLALGNTAPRFTSAPTTEAVVNVTYRYQPTAADAENQPVAFRLLTSPDGMTIDPATGRVTWTPTAEQVGTHQIELVADDGRGGVALQRFNLAVALDPANRAPIFRSAPVVQIAPGDDYHYLPTVTDADGDTLQFFLDEGPTGATFNSTTGELFWADAVTGTYAVKIRVDDGQGASATQAYVLAVGVASANPHLPTIRSTAPAVAVVDQPYVYLPRAEDADGDTLAYSLLTFPTGMNIDAATGRITWTPTAAQLGSQPVVLKVDDQCGGFALQSFTIAVLNQRDNASPVIRSQALRVVTQDELYDYTVAASDPEGQAVAFDLFVAASGMSIDPISGWITWTPTDAQVGTHRIQVRASDPHGAFALQTFDLVVLATNVAPEITTEPVAAATVGSIYRYDVDVADDDPVAFSLQTSIPGMTISPRTGVIRWTPTAEQLGPHTVTVRATDERGLFTDQTFTLTVLPDTEAPSVSVLLSDDLANPGDTVTVWVLASDNAQISSLTLQIDGLDVPLDSTGTAVYTITRPGLIQVVATATDTSGNSGSAARRIRVIDPNDTESPFVQITSPTFGATVSYLTQITGTVTDPNFEFYRLQYALAGTDEWTTFQESFAPVVDGVLGTFDPTLLANDIYDLRVMAQDTSGNLWYEPLELNVVGNAKLGNFRLDFTDLTIPLAGIPIEIHRTYDTLVANQSGDFGFGWQFSYAQANIRETVRVSDAEKAGVPSVFGSYPFRVGTRVYITNPEGRRVGFTFDPIREDYDPVTGNPYLFGSVYRPRFVADPGVYDTLTVPDMPLSLREDGTYTLYLYNFAYNPNEYTLTTKDGVSFRYDQFEGLKDITDRNQNVLTYTADGIYSSTGQSIQWRRDAQGRITEIIDPAGNSLLYQYDASGDLVSFTNQSGGHTTYHYRTDRPHYFDHYVCPLGLTLTRTEYDESGRVSGIYDANGNPITQTYDLENNTEVIADREGNETTLVFDDRGNIVRRIDPLGRETMYTYGANDNETSVTNSRGYKTTYAYDLRGNVTSITDALGGVTSYTYNRFNQVLTKTDALGRTTENVFDAVGNLVRQLDAVGNSEFQTFDPSGRVTSRTDRNGNTTIYAYAQPYLSEPTQVINPDGTYQQMTYNGLGQVTMRTDEMGNHTQYTYSSVGLPVSVRQPNGQTTTNTYAALRVIQQTTTITASENRVSRLAYDAAGNVVQVTDPNGGITTYAYDANCNLTSLTDPVNNTTQYGYDAMGHRIVCTDPLGQSRFLGYDSQGNVVEIVDRDGRRRTFEYDAVDRVIAEKWWNGSDLLRTISSTYDAVGNLLTKSDVSSTYAFAYDELNRLITVDNAGTPDSPHLILTYTYDATGNVLSVADDRGAVVDSTYGSRNQLLSRQWHGGGIDPARLDFVHNGRNDCVGIERFADLAGTLRIGRTTRAYDESGRPIGIQHLDALDSVLADYDYRYDLASRVIQETHHNDTVDYTYDRFGQLLAADHTRLPDEFYAYDANGNRIHSSLHGDSYQTGPDNQLLSDGMFNYTYDGEGNLVTKTEIATGRVTTYTYDHRNRLVMVQERSAEGLVLREVTYTYDVSDRRILETLDADGEGPAERVCASFVHDGLHTWADYDATGQVVARYLFGDRIDEIIARWRLADGTAWYLTDRLGSVQDVVGATGMLLTHVDYDNFGNVLGQTGIGASDRFLFTARELDAELGLYHFRARSYLPAHGRFLTKDPLGFHGGHANLYCYAGNDPVNKTDPAGTLAISEWTIGDYFTAALVIFDCTPLVNIVPPFSWLPWSCWLVVSVPFTLLSNVNRELSDVLGRQPE